MNTTNQEPNKSKSIDRYYLLWHLVALQVIEAKYGQNSSQELDGADGGEAEQFDDLSKTSIHDEPTPKIYSTQWEKILEHYQNEVEPTRVALIDVGVDSNHPNLKSRIDWENSIDLTMSRYGTKLKPPRQKNSQEKTVYFPTTEDESKKGNFFDTLEITDLAGDLKLEPRDKDYLDIIVKDLKGSSGDITERFESSHAFDTHGTAAAGLIVGDPALWDWGAQEEHSEEMEYVIAELAASFEAEKPRSDTAKQVLPYFGVDPFSRLVSIKTSFEADPHQFISAFLYAYSQDVDVIVLPRGIPDPVRGRLAPKKELISKQNPWSDRLQSTLVGRLAQNKTLHDLFKESVNNGHEIDIAKLNAALRNDYDPKASQQQSADTADWCILRALIIAISKKIPIVCAAGNSGESQLIYPANLAGEDNGIVSVGAITAEGFRSSYSNYGENLTLVAPSDDAEVFNRHQLRIDENSPFAGDHERSTPGQKYVLSQLELVSTDLPGVYGYDEGLTEELMVGSEGQERVAVSGSYTAFGGTSGAAALIGGVAALVQRSYRAFGGKKGKLDGVKLKEILKSSCGFGPVPPGRRKLQQDNMNAADEDGKDKSYFFGAGLLNASKAIDDVQTLVKAEQAESKENSSQTV